jgi:hypothetical protein
MPENRSAPDFQIKHADASRLGKLQAGASWDGLVGDAQARVCTCADRNRLQQHGLRPAADEARAGDH